MAPLVYWPPLGHLAILLALTAVCLLRLDQMPALPDADATTAAQSAADTLAGDLIAMPDVGIYADVLPAMDDRPLFLSGRQLPDIDGAPTPARATAPADERPDQTELNVKMKGSIGQGNAMRAQVIVLPDGDEIWVQVGDDLAGWQVIDIAPRALSLQLGDRTATFQMFE